MDIDSRMRTLLQGAEVSYFVIQSVIDELRSLGAKASKTLEFINAKCNAIDDRSFSGVTASEKTEYLIGKLDRFCAEVYAQL